jgi:hypothetical protein
MDARKYILILCIFLMIALPTAGCAAPEPGPEPYEYVHSTEPEQFVIYENERLQDAARSVVATLEELGYDDLTLDGGEETGTASIEYMLSDDATQGPDIWYLINFHFFIEFAEDTGGGFAEVRASPGPSVQFETMRVNDSPLVRVNELSSASTCIEVRFFNYLSLRGIGPGKNELTFKVKEYQGSKIKNVTVYKDTAIESTAVAPSTHDEGLGLSPAERERAEEIAFGDAQVQRLLEGKEYAIRITRADDLIRLADDSPDDDIEVRLVFARNYMIEDIEASALDVFVDLNEGAVTYVFPLGTNGMPELTESVRGKVVDIALDDAGVQQELAGKPYAVERVGITMGGPAGRLGANVLFAFDTPYPLERENPMMPERQVTGVTAIVNLKEEKVVDIFVESKPVD